MTAVHPVSKLLGEWRALADAATEGPWCHYPEAGDIEIGAGATEAECADILVAGVRPFRGWGERIYVDNHEPDADFIAASRAIVPKLLTALEKVLSICDDTDIETTEALQEDVVYRIRAALNEALETNE